MKLAAAALLLSAVAFAIFSSGVVVVADPDLLQDVCVADYASTVKINGFPCKATFSAADFSSTLLAKPGLTNNTLGSLIDDVEVEKIKAKLSPKKS
ncbi:hypothetical protein MLD38_035855 [Melastoma candidum]|uniref:Uncharacterized protein n=1 Tax=Melastoma candidum TaxID=119954 RepID=A0ACB9LJR1_9MYRT|nr:hypothetical protein MLD38_035855 [Melastoma candidum]